MSPLNGRSPVSCNVLYYEVSSEHVTSATGCNDHRSNLGRRSLSQIQTRPHKLWGQPTVQFNWYQGSFPGIQRPGSETDHFHVAPRFRRSGDTPLLPTYALLAVTVQFYLNHLCITTKIHNIHIGSTHTPHTYTHTPHTHTTHTYTHTYTNTTHTHHTHTHAPHTHTPHSHTLHTHTTHTPHTHTHTTHTHRHVHIHTNLVP